MRSQHNERQCLPVWAGHLRAAGARTMVVWYEYGESDVHIRFTNGGNFAPHLLSIKETSERDRP